MKYRITMEGPGGTVDSGLLAGNGSGVNYTAKVLPGSWNILVKAYNVDNTLRAHSRFTVTVSGGGTAAPTYTLTPIVSVKSWAELKDALAGGNTAGLVTAISEIVQNGDTIYITADLVADSTIAVNSSAFNSITLAAEGNITINRDPSFIGFNTFFFTVATGKTFTLGDSSGTLILDGGGTSGYSLINVSGGTLTMQGNTTLRNNRKESGDGGAVSVSGGIFNMNGGTISGNAVHGGAAVGGGVSVAGSGTFNMNGGTISGNNTPNGNGGGVGVRQGTFTMNDGTISGNGHNSPSGYGGAVSVESNGIFTMNGGTIGPNNRANHGGGVSLATNNSTFNMVGGSISGNTAVILGGGVYVNNMSTAVFTMTGGTISGNSAPSLSGASLYKAASGIAIYGDATYIVGPSASIGYTDDPITGHP
jgi:hypothetical protein